MALIDCDSFDGYGTLSANGWLLPSSDSVSLNASNGRNGTASIRCGDWDENAYRQIGAGNYTTIVTGFAFKFSAFPTSAQPFIRLQESANATTHVAIYVTTAGALYIARDTTQLGSATADGILTTNVYAYIELKTVIADSTGGSAILCVNGTELLNLTSQDTRNGGSGTVSYIQIGGLNNQTGILDYDDLYVRDGGDFLGDVRVQALFASGNGNSSQLVGSDGNSTDNYQLVDESSSTWPNTTDYVESSTVGDKDTYAFGDLTPTTGTVYGLKISAYAQKTDAGARSIATVARLSGTEVDSGNLSLSTSWQYLSDIRETKPGGGAWSISDVNSAEFGIKITA